jgi:hypothetical protein
MGATAEDTGGGDGALADGGATDEEGAPQAPSDVDAVRIRDEQFAADVRKARARVLLGEFLAYNESQDDAAARAGCVTVSIGPGLRVPAFYDAAPAVLVLRPPSGEVQVVDLYVCGDTAPRRSITLPAP